MNEDQKQEATVMWEAGYSVGLIAQRLRVGLDKVRACLLDNPAHAWHKHPCGECGYYLDLCDNEDFCIGCQRCISEKPCDDPDCPAVQARAFLAGATVAPATVHPDTDAEIGRGLREYVVEIERIMDMDDSILTLKNPLEAIQFYHGESMKRLIATLSENTALTAHAAELGGGMVLRFRHMENRFWALIDPKTNEPWTAIAMDWFGYQCKENCQKLADFFGAVAVFEEDDHDK